MLAGAYNVSLGTLFFKASSDLEDALFKNLSFLASCGRGWDNPRLAPARNSDGRAMPLSLCRNSRIRRVVAACGSSSSVGAAHVNGKPGAVRLLDRSVDYGQST